VSRTRDFSKLINGIAASKITSGTLDDARLSNIDSDYIQLRQSSADLTSLSASNLTSGSIPTARIADDTITAGQLADDIAISTTAAIQGSQFNVGGLKILEEAEFGFGDGSANKVVNTAYAYTFSLAAGTWLPLIKCYGAFFENHGNSNSVGLYYVMNRIGTTSGGEDIANEWIISPKWGNSTNSYNTSATSVGAGQFTLGSTTTLHATWNCIEYGTSSNYWVRNGGFGAKFYRLG